MAVVQAFSVKAGYNIATVTGTANIPISGTFYWGTATGVYTNVTPFTQSTYEWQPDNTLQYRLTFTLTNVQNNGSTNYFGKIFFNDGTASAELTWTTPGQNGNGNDNLFFLDRIDPTFAAIADVAIRGASQGWLLPQEWADWRRLIMQTLTFNTVTKWNDGR